MSRTTDIAWAAGLFEGEGCIYISNHGTYPQGRLEIRMTDEDVLNRFCEIVGRGKVASRSYDQPPNATKRVYKWGVYSREGVYHVLHLLTPYFGKRRTAKAEEMLEIISQREEVIKIKN